MDVVQSTVVYSLCIVMYIGLWIDFMNNEDWNTVLKKVDDIFLGYISKVSNTDEKYKFTIDDEIHVHIQLSSSLVGITCGKAYFQMSVEYVRVVNDKSRMCSFLEFYDKHDNRLCIVVNQATGVSVVQGYFI